MAIMLSPYHCLRCAVIVALAVVVSFCTYAQADYVCNSENGYDMSIGRQFVNHTELPDSSDVARMEKKSFWRASAETAGFNLGLWAFDRYIQKGHFAYISWDTIKENFRHGFEWDNDHLSTNMFAHPYNGSLFYNAGRSNGYNFWQSELFAIGGSAMWEMLMEREYPSTNDILATPVGGAAIGEVLYRASDILLDDRSSGAERFGRELAAFVVSPMRGFTRIVTGRAWAKRPSSGRRFGIPPVSVDFSLGAKLLVFQDDGQVTKSGGNARVLLEYGDPFAKRTEAPYDYFSFLLELNAMRTQPLLARLEIIGRLLSKEIIDSRKCRLSVGMYQHFDYFDSDTISDKSPSNFFSPCKVPYKLGTPASVGGGIMFRFEPDGKSVVDSYAHVNTVILSGVLSDFYRFYHRNYNWASGFSVKAGSKWKRGIFSVSVDYSFYQLYTWHGWDENVDWSMTPEGRPANVQGDGSRTSFSHLEARADYRLCENLYATLGLEWFYRHTSYDRSAEVLENGHRFGLSNIIIDSHQTAIRFMLTYKL